MYKNFCTKATVYSQMHKHVNQEPRKVWCIKKIVQSKNLDFERQYLPNAKAKFVAADWGTH